MNKLVSGAMSAPLADIYIILYQIFNMTIFNMEIFIVYIFLIFLYESSWSHAWNAIAWSIFKDGTVKDMGLFSFATVLMFHDRVLFNIENALFPTPRRHDLNRVFVLGHHRSGTTNLYKNIINNANGQVSYNTFFQQLIHSRSLSTITYPILECFSNAYTNEHHPLNLNDPEEGHHILNHYYNGPAFVLLFSKQVGNSIINGHTKLFTTDFTDMDFDYYDKIIPIDIKNDIFIDKPLDFLSSFNEMYKKYPNAKYIIVERDIIKALESWKGAVKDHIDIENKNYLKGLTISKLKNIKKMKNMNKPEQFHFVQFEEYIKDKSDTLDHIFDFIGVDPPENYIFEPPEKHHQSKNYKRETISFEMIEYIQDNIT